MPLSFCKEKRSKNVAQDEDKFLGGDLVSEKNKRSCQVIHFIPRTQIALG